MKNKYIKKRLLLMIETIEWGLSPKTKRPEFTIKYGVKNSIAYREAVRDKNVLKATNK